MRTQAESRNWQNAVPTKTGEEMQIPREAVLLRIFFGENDKFHRLPLHEAIVLKAREMHLAGATVLRGHIGFGHSSRIHASKVLRLSQDLPVVVEIIDSQEKIDAFLPVLDGMMSSGLITLERAEVLQYGTEETRPAPIHPTGLR
jgi:PII-like signaling protein